MILPRSSGVLAHPTSLPGADGVGTLGAEARAFVDRLAEADQSWWQILPLNAPGPGGSPYSAVSAFAGNPLMIDLEPLRRNGYVTGDEIGDFRRRVAGSSDERVDYGSVEREKAHVVDLAFARWKKDEAGETHDFENFVEGESDWLDDYALYCVLKERFEGKSWREWPREFVERDRESLQSVREAHADDMERIAFAQWLFFRQWAELRDYARKKGVRLIGDIPIFVAMDSADVWADRELFQLDEEGRAEEVSGVPPDYFSETGQKWGNPLYDWRVIEARGYDWWLRRVEKVLETVDLVRIDHFRGLQAYWAVPADAPTAKQGEWRDGPSDAFFEAVRRNVGEVPFIAEDLGMITDDVIALRDRHDLPGMKVIQFADFDDPDHIFRPENYARNFVAYTGTHDNDTTRGWFDALDEDQRHKVRQYLSCSDEEVVWSAIEAVFGSQAALAVVPVQDVFELGSEARMNNPGGDHDNWTWRMPPELIEPAEPWDRLGEVTRSTDRDHD